MAFRIMASDIPHGGSSRHSVTEHVTCCHCGDKDANLHLLHVNLER